MISAAFTPTVVAAPEAIMAEVLIYTNQELLAKFAIEHGEYIIGRDITCHILVEAEQVSRHHARLTFAAFELLVEDLGSSNGVFIDGVEVQIPTRVRPDQEVQIGSARLYFRLKDSASQQLAAALWDKDLGLAPVRELLEGKKHKVITTIGRGGMGVVMQARDVRIRRTVAMKVMKTSAQFSRENVLRFVDEAQLTGQLEHPNIVPVYELGIDEHGETFYTMKFVKGITLAEVLRGLRSGRAATVEKYPLATLLTIFQKICDAVAFAHSKGVIHRDLKPENVMIGAYGEVLVMDWGLAKNMTGAHRAEGKVDTLGEGAPMADPRGFQTMHGLIVGTPPYISPEQARGDLEQIDARSDVYVLGQILYTILTLRAPVSGATVPEIVENILANRITPPMAFNTPLKPLRKSTDQPIPEHVPLVHCPGRRIPESLAAVPMKAMHHDAAARYQSVEEMQAEITAWQGGFATKAERAGVLKHSLLWAARHKGELALLIVGFVIFNVMVVSFILQLSREKNRALENEQRALANEQLAAERLAELRGTAPTFFQEAQSLLEDRKFEEALEKVDYAIAQVPNEPKYHLLRGKLLQTLLRWEEAVLAFEESLRRDPHQPDATLNLKLTWPFAEFAHTNGVAPVLLQEFHEALLQQNRLDEARAFLSHLPADRERSERTWTNVLEQLKSEERTLEERLEMTEDGMVRADFSRMTAPDLSALAEMPVESLNLDDARLPDLAALREFELESLSLNRTSLTDLTPLAGLTLRSLAVAGTQITDLGPIARLPLESLDVSDTRVASLAPLRGLRVEQLQVANCRNIQDLSPLLGMPLQSLDASRTGISDLTPLIASPLRELNLQGCAQLHDLHALLAMKTLEAVLIPAGCRDIAYLRAHPTLKRLSYTKLTQPAAEFWAEFDREAKSAAK